MGIYPVLPDFVALDSGGLMVDFSVVTRFSFVLCAAICPRGLEASFVSS